MVNNPHEALAARLKTVFAGASNRKIAEQLDISEGSVRNYLRGSSAPDTQLLTRISDLYGVSIFWLMGQVGGDSGGARSAVDVGLLRVCIEGLEEALEQRQATMPASKKADLVVKLYDLHQAADSPPQKATILQFIKRAA